MSDSHISGGMAKYSSVEKLFPLPEDMEAEKGIEW